MRPSKPRRIELTDGALKDLKWQQVTRKEAVAMFDALRRVGSLPMPEADAAVEEQRWSEWLRLKLREPRQLRVFFTYDAETVTVHLILARADNTYLQAKLVYAAQQRRTA